MRYVGLTAIFVLGFLGGLALGLRVEEKACFKRLDFDKAFCAQQMQTTVDAAVKHQRDICKRGLR